MKTSSVSAAIGEPTAVQPRPYEDPALRAALDDVLHPGGPALTDQALAACSLPSGARVLDIGCGPGMSTAHLRTCCGLDAVGVDLSAALLESGHEREPALLLVQAQGDRLPFASGIADAILAECSLSLLPSVDVALAEFARLLKHDGRLLLTDLYLRAAEGRAQVEISRQQPLTCLAGALSKAQLEERLAAHGFAVLIWQDCSGALKEWAARLILAGLEPAHFWGVATTADHTACLRPGYFWLVAVKLGSA